MPATRTAGQELTLRSLIGRIWLGLLIAAGCYSLAGIADTGFPLLFKALLDGVLLGGSLLALAAVSACFVVLAVLVVGFQFLGTYAGTWAAERLTVFLRELISERALRLDEGVEKPLAVGERTALIVRDASTVGGFFRDPVNAVPFQVVRFVAALVILGLLDYRLLAVAPIAIVAFLVGPMIMRGKVSHASRDWQDSEAEVSARSTELFSDVPGLVSQLAIPWALRELLERFLASRVRHLKLVRVSVAAEGGFVALWLVYGLSVFTGGLEVRAGRLSLGGVIAAVQLMGDLALPTQMAAAAYQAYTVMLGSLTRIQDFLSRHPAVVFSTTGGNREQNVDALPLCLRDVSLEFRTTGPVLTSLNLSVQPGEWLALVGASGAGKSSMLGLMAGLLVPSSGTVAAGGRPLQEWAELSFRKQVRWTSGEPPVYRGSIATNILLDRKWAPSADLAALVDVAGLGELVSRYGLHGTVDEGGGNLSRGERQRIGLARALAGRPRILLLDEAMNSLDSESEAGVLERLREYLREIAVVIVSHRLSTIKHCQRVVVLESGRLVHEGQVDGSLATENQFRALVRDQIIATLEQ